MGFRRTGDVPEKPRFTPRVVRDPYEKGPWFPARFEGTCDTSGDFFDEGDEIRADGQGGWEARECCGEDSYGNE